jgi:hypothetical protein
MMETVKQSEEEFVRGVWEWVIVRKRDDRLEWEWFGSLTFQAGPLLRDTEAEAWSAAAAYTRERLEQVRQVTREIEVCGRWSHTYTMRVTDSYLPNKYNIVGPVRDFIACTRICARLEAELASLTAGMKAGA